VFGDAAIAHGGRSAVVPGGAVGGWFGRIDIGQWLVPTPWNELRPCQQIKFEGRSTAFPEATIAVVWDRPLPSSHDRLPSPLAFNPATALFPNHTRIRIKPEGLGYHSLGLARYVPTPG